MSENRVFGTYYFGIAIVDGASYKYLLIRCFLQMLPGVLSESAVQQNGTWLYYSLEMRHLLDEKLSNLWIERGGLASAYIAPPI